MFVCWSAKGGSGTTVVAAALALVHARSRHTILVDAGADQPAALGIAEPSGPGITEWLASPDADADTLHRLSVPVTDGLHLLHTGSAPLELRRWPALLEALATDGDTVVIDAGVHVPPDRFGPHAISVLVTRACYLSMRRVASAPARPDGIVLLREPGRVLDAGDVERAVGAPVLAQIPWDPAVARAVDAGLLASRVPASLQQPLRRAS